VYNGKGNAKERSNHEALDATRSGALQRRLLYGGWGLRTSPFLIYSKFAIIILE